MLELQEQGAHNINLVTATHYAHLLPTAIGEARRRGLSIPIVYNTSGYEREEAVAELAELVDVWLVDYKYADADLGRALSHVVDYPRRRRVPYLACAPRWPPAGRARRCGRHDAARGDRAPLGASRSRG
ncbi:MAG: hypothetical protein ACLTKG_00960 [Collinsella intestinalis]